MILNYVIGSIHHYHNIQCVIVCQSSLHNVFCVPYSLDQTLWLIINILSINFVHLLFERGNYSRVAFILLSQSLRWHRRERSSIEQLLDRQGNLLVVADSLLKLRCHSDTPGVLVHLFTNDTRKGVSGCHGNLCSLSLKTKFTEKRYVLFNFVIRMRFRLSKPVK